MATMVGYVGVDPVVNAFADCLLWRAALVSLDLDHGAVALIRPCERN